MDLVVFDPNPSRGRLKKVERVDVELVGWMGYQLVEQLKPGLVVMKCHGILVLVRSGKVLSVLLWVV